MNLDKAEQFLKYKGLDTEKYRIKDVNGGYLPQIPIALWLTEFAEQVKNNDLLHDVGVREFECGDVVCTNEGKMWVITEIDGDDVYVTGNGKKDYPLEKSDITHAH